MTDFPGEATLFRIAAERLAGKPFTVSEYNHPAPLDAQAECVPMTASFAAAQDWDGVWFYTYSHSGDGWEREHLSSYFDIDTNPAKWGFMRAGAAIFCDEGIGPLEQMQSVPIADGWSKLAVVAQHHLQHDRDMLGLLLRQAGGMSRSDMLETILIPSVSDAPQTAPSSQGDIPDITWTVDGDENGVYQVIGPSAQVFTGHADRLEQTSRGALRIASPQFAVVTVTELGTSDVLLVSACGRCENTDMQFSTDRRTVGRNWGRAPVRIEPVEGTLTLPEGRWICHALAPNGAPAQRVPLSYQGEQGVLEMSAEFETLWYLLKRSTR
jgi:hypothetical protein